MASLVIVAIPSSDDDVWKISSEKIPHLTLLFLGDVTSVPTIPKIAEFLEHASNYSLNRFYLDVDKRGILGKDEADVLFFSKNEWNLKTIKDFRSFLLQDNNIKTAYQNAEQFDGWTPHLTLGYPATPAKSDNRDYRRFSSVRFDKIALWYGDYTGPEFELKTEEWDMEVSMDAVQATKDVLAHYGKKGMRWGVRNSDRATAAAIRKSAPQQDVIIRTKRKNKTKAKGGEGLPIHSDAIAKVTVGQVKKKSGINAISNQDLQAYAQRLQLEQNVKRLEAEQKPGRAFVKSFLQQKGKQKLSTTADDAMSRKAKKAIKN